jgi:DNA-binding beta-propeller fold protein YncE
LKSFVGPLLPTLAFFFVAMLIAGCDSVVNNNLQVTTTISKNVSGGSVAYAPLGSQSVSGQWLSDIPTSSSLNTIDVTPGGSVYSFDVTTDPILGTFVDNNVRMPAYWDFSWSHPSYCIEQSSPSYPLLPNPFTANNQVVLPNVGTTDWEWGIGVTTGETITQAPDPVLQFNCFTNTPANPDFLPSEVSPQFVLDNALPATIQVAAFSPIDAAASITNLHVYSMSFTNPANVTAESVASGGGSAVFPYPTAAGGAALPAGAYITTITTDPVGGSQTTNGMEPIYIAHNNTSYTSAFGVDVAIPSETVQTMQWVGNQYGPCAGGATTSTTNYGGSTLPLVTLTTQGKLAVGTASNTISVGVDPTVVIAYNSVPQTITQTGACGPTSVISYSGAQSALVVNTGSNTVSLLDIGEYGYPSGTVTVGTSPVAAVINPAGTLAYIANYASGTISEVSLSGVQVTRTLAVGTHPVSVAFDSGGNLWVGGQGYLETVSITNWKVGTTFAVNGTVTGMSYDTGSGNMVASLMQNGAASAPSKVITGTTGTTEADAIAYSKVVGVSYSTTSLISVANGSASSTSEVSDTAPYVSSSLASSLAFPAQNAFTPPIYSSSNGDLVASANGTSFTVSAISTGNVLISGTTPFPIRGVKLTSTMLYFTMPDSNSLVTLPIQLP